VIGLGGHMHRHYSWRVEVAVDVGVRGSVDGWKVDGEEGWLLTLLLINLATVYV